MGVVISAARIRGQGTEDREQGSVLNPALHFIGKAPQSWPNSLSQYAKVDD